MPNMTITDPATIPTATASRAAVQTPFQRILVATDFSPGSSRAMDTALELAEAVGSRQVRLLHAWRPPRLLDAHGLVTVEGQTRTRAAVTRERADRSLGHGLAAARRTAAAGLVISGEVVHGPAPAAILDAQRSERFDLIVLGTRGRRGVARLLLGSVTEEVLRRACCPVLTVSERGAETPPRGTGTPPRGHWAADAGDPAAAVDGAAPGRILVPVDFSDCSAQALELAARLARGRGDRMEVLHVVDLPRCGTPLYPGNRTMDLGALPDLLAHARQTLSRLLARYDDVRVFGRVVFGYTPETILDRLALGRHRTAVLGTHGRRGWNRLMLGSVAEAVVRRAPCPVLTVRHPEAHA